MYPLTVYLFSKVYNKKIFKKKIYPKVSLLISAFNEEEVIEKKIQNSLSLIYPREKLEIIVVSDGSTDNTNSIIQSYSSNEDIKGILLNKNKGKTTAINKALDKATGEIIVFTDANVWLNKHAVTELVSNFYDDNVGCVCGQLNYYNSEDSQTASSGGLYWHYEEFIKKYESQSGSTMGADGSIFAIRRKLYKKHPEYLIDDFSTSMGVLFQGYRVVFENSAKAYEKHTTNLNDEIRRRQRISNRVFTAILYYKKELFNMRFFDKYKFLMHKFLRYIAALLMIIAYISNVALAIFSEVYLILFIFHSFFYLLVLIGFLLFKLNSEIKLFYIPYYFTIMNWMQLLGVYDSVRGIRQVTWNTKSSSRDI